MTEKNEAKEAVETTNSTPEESAVNSQKEANENPENTENDEDPENPEDPANPEDPDEDEPPPSMLMLKEVDEAIGRQLIRLRTKKVHDLTQELQFNAYPLLGKLTEAIGEFMADFYYPEDDEEGDDEETAAMREAFEKSLAEFLEICNAILEMDAKLEPKVKAKLPEQYGKIVAWAKTKKEEIEKVKEAANG